MTLRKHARSKCVIRPYSVRASAFIHPCLVLLCQIEKMILAQGSKLIAIG